MSYYSDSFESFFESAEIRDVLDSITVITEAVKGEGIARRWLDFVEKIFREENLEYTVDQAGIVHFFIDKEFEENKLSTLACLNAPKYNAVRNEFEEAYKSLDLDPPDTKESIRRIFESLEIIYKLITNRSGNSRLAARSVQSDIVPVVTQMYENDETAMKAATGIVKSFGEWVTSAHWYRHGQNTEEPINPPLELTVVFISNGSSYLRWLVELDQLKAQS